jgi:hypothetical protein
MTILGREPSADDLAGVEWWNSLSEPRRSDWLRLADSTKPADAWTEYKRRVQGDHTKVTAANLSPPDLAASPLPITRRAFVRE